MGYSFSKITKEEFGASTATMLFCDAPYNRCFALLRNGAVAFKLAWKSDLIDPVIAEISPNVVAIGIDQDFAVVDLSVGAIRFTIKFYAHFFSLDFEDEQLLISTELEVFVFDPINFCITRTIALPEIFETFIRKNDQLFAKCMNSELVLISAEN